MTGADRPEYATRLGLPGYHDLAYTKTLIVLALLVVAIGYAVANPRAWSRLAMRQVG